MLSIRVDSIESTRIVRIDWSLVPRFKNKEGSCIVISRILTSGGLCRVGWKCCRIDTNRFPCCRFVMPELDLRDATPCESSWDVTCESSRIVKCLRRIDSVWVYWTWMEIWRIFQCLSDSKFARPASCKKCCMRRRGKFALTCSLRYLIKTCTTETWFKIENSSNKNICYHTLLFTFTKYVCFTYLFILLCVFCFFLCFSAKYLSEVRAFWYI